MAKSLSERIAARSATKKQSRSAKNRAAFLALRADIKDALKDGWPIKSIWETLHEEGKIDFSYQTFRGYVNRLIQPAMTKSAPSPPALITEANEAMNPGTTNKKTPVAIGKESAAVGFKFNPNANKEELF